MFERMFLVVVLAAAAAAAYGTLDREGNAGPFAATVNGVGISAHQVDGMLARPGAALPGHGKRSKARALERLIDQELLAQEARKAKLDQDPRVVQAVQDATRRILGQAYLERIVASAREESGAQVKKFYRENPALFERRRIYRVLELAVVSPQDRLAGIREAAARAQSLHDVAAWLETRRLPYNVATSSRPAEQIPLSVLREVYEMRQGQIAVFPTPRGASVVQLLLASDVPMKEQEAAPVIERYLVNRRRLEIGVAEARKLRDQATIEYGSEFEPVVAQGPAVPRAIHRAALVAAAGAPSAISGPGQR